MSQGDWFIHGYAQDSLSTGSVFFVQKDAFEEVSIQLVLNSAIVLILALLLL